MTLVEKRDQTLEEQNKCTMLIFKFSLLPFFFCNTTFGLRRQNISHNMRKFMADVLRESYTKYEIVVTSYGASGLRMVRFGRFYGGHPVICGFYDEKDHFVTTFLS